MARPKGSSNKPRPIADTVATRCPSCGSTRRAPYNDNPTRHDVPGEYQGTPYTSVIWRRTHCLDCGQHRIDREFINEPAGEEENTG